MTDTDYDLFAEAYVAQSESGLFNRYYEQPATLRLAGDVAGHRVLDAGCGAGPLMESLRAKGASVAGFDRSAAMIDFARRRLGTDAELRVADLADPLPYGDREFDDVFCSLALHYLQDWSGPLSEFRRVLKPGGRVFISVNHPAAYAIEYPDGNYFGITKHTEDYEMDGQTVYLTFWHRPLHAMADAFTAAGLRITAISEPPVAPDTPPDLIPAGFEGKSFIGFLFFALEAA